jgi:hypothetical protein|tara:strand:+ start:165 stop:1274 length:1110 start_codon:yes stop_codon:yes gene_type:complete
MQMENSQDQYIEGDYKILLRFAKNFFKTKTYIYIILLLFFILGVISVILTPTTYVSKVTFISQGSSNTKMSGGLSSIAKLLSGSSTASGGNENSDIPLFLYPKIMESLPYKRKLYNTHLYIKELDSTVTFKKYALQIERPPFFSNILKYTIGLPKILLGNDSKTNESVEIDSLLYSHPNENKVLQSLNDKVLFEMDEEDGTLTINVSFVGEPEASAQLAQNAQNILQEEIIHYRILKAKEKYHFLKKQYKQQKEKYDLALANLAIYSDRNLYNNTKSSLLKKQELENQIVSLYTIFSDLDQQLLAQEVKIQEDTPSFTIIDPAVVPVSSKPSKTIFKLLSFLLFGFFISILRYIYILIKNKLRETWDMI